MALKGGGESTSVPAYSQPPVTGNPCNCCCPGMHDSTHNHPPPILQFLLDMGGNCDGCVLSGYLIWIVGDPLNKPSCFPGPGMPCPQCADYFYTCDGVTII